MKPCATNRVLQSDAFRKGTTPKCRHRSIQRSRFPPEKQGGRRGTAATPSRRTRHPRAPSPSTWQSQKEFSPRKIILASEAEFSPRQIILTSEAEYTEPSPVVPPPPVTAPWPPRGPHDHGHQP